MAFSAPIVARSCALLAAMYMAAQPAPSGDSGSATVPLRVAVEPECDVNLSDARAGAEARGPGYRSVSGAARFRYRIRTASPSGSGAVYFRMDGLEEGGTLSYSSTLQGTGTPGSGEQRVDAGVATEVVVARFGPNQHTSTRGDAGSVVWQIRYPSAQSGAPAPVPQLRCVAR